MGKITDALRKATEERLNRLDRVAKIDESSRLVVKKMKDSAIDSRVIAHFDPKSPVTEQYKILKTNLLSIKEKVLKTIAITSSIHAEGKTLTSLNLAVTLAHTASKPKVLLLDADMRRGSIAKYLGVKVQLGLSDYLSGNANLEGILFKVDIDNLAVIACGKTPSHPVELLGSKKMKSLLLELKSKFDYVIIDTPPLIPVTDPGILGAQADGVLMIIQAGRTQRGMVKRGIESLHQARARLLGHVLTNVEYHLPQYIYRYL